MPGCPRPQRVGSPVPCGLNIKATWCCAPVMYCQSPNHAACTAARRFSMPCVSKEQVQGSAVLCKSNAQRKQVSAATGAGALRCTAHVRVIVGGLCLIICPATIIGNSMGQIQWARPWQTHSKARTAPAQALSDQEACLCRQPAHELLSCSSTALCKYNWHAKSQQK